MVDAIAVETWTNLLNQLEGCDPDVINQDDIYVKLEGLFKHIKPQAAKRHQFEIEACTIKTNELLPKLFDNIDCSNRQLFTNFLAMVLSYGYLRLAQITYYNAPTIIDPTDLGSIYLTLITKCSWHDLGPLLPKAGEMKWKGVLNSGLVKEEKLLMPICLKLMTQKLHFYSVVMNLQQYQAQKSICKTNGRRVAEKLIEIIRDVAFNDELYFMGMNGQLFNFLVPFIDEDQLTCFIDAIVEDLFKPFNHQNDSDDLYANEVANLHKTVKECLIDDSKYQGLLITSFIDHLKCNLIRRKRRHSIENENGSLSFADLLSNINSSTSDTNGLMKQVGEITLTAKGLQTSYLKYWISMLNSILQHATLTHTNSIRLFGATTIVFACVCEFLDDDLTNDLCMLIAKIIDVTLRFKYDKLFNSFKPQYLLDLCQILSERTRLFSNFNAPTQHVLRSYLSKYLVCSAINRVNCDVKKLTPFINTICEGSLGKRPSRFLQYICIREIANFIEMLKSKLNANMSLAFYEWTSKCSEKLYKFIKRNCRLTVSPSGNTSQSEQDSISESDSKECKELYYNVATHSLVCILKISIDLAKPSIIEKYGEILLKFFDDVTTRIHQLANSCKKGKSVSSLPLDNHLTKLLKLYVEHQDAIKGYFNYDIVEVLSKLFMINEIGPDVEIETCNEKKLLYNNIKTKLQTIQETSTKNSNLYVTIINQQYSSATDDVIGSLADIKREKTCCYNYCDQMIILNDITDILMDKCTPKLYRNVFENVVKSMEASDPLDHPLIIYSFLMLRSLCSRYKINPKPPQGMIDYFSNMLPRISGCLIRISKSVELGPSIHAFTNPGSHSTNRSAQCCIYSNCIQLYSHIFQRCPINITNPLITDAFEIIVGSNLNVYAMHSEVMNKYFSQLAFAINKLLKSMSFGHKDVETLASSMPTFLAILSNLIRCVIMASRVTSHERDNQVQENGYKTKTMSLRDLDEFKGKLELLAIDIGRTLNNLSFLRVKLVEYAPHLITAYIKDCQSCHCPGNVKIHLDIGIFRIFNLVDAHQIERQEDIIQKGIQRKTTAAKAKGSLFEMIHARLDQASREVFRDLHDNYSQFHRYLGKL